MFQCTCSNVGSKQRPAVELEIWVKASQGVMDHGGGHELRWILTTHPASRLEPLGGTSGTGMFNIRQQPLRQKVGQEALGMWGKMLLETHGGRGLKWQKSDTLRLCRDTEKCERDPQKRTKVAFMGPRGSPRTLYTPWLTCLTLSLDFIASLLEQESYVRNHCPHTPKVPSAAEYWSHVVWKIVPTSVMKMFWYLSPSGLKPWESVRGLSLKLKEPW